MPIRQSSSGRGGNVVIPYTGPVVYDKPAAEEVSLPAQVNAIQRQTDVQAVEPEYVQPIQQQTFAQPVQAAEARQEQQQIQQTTTPEQREQVKTENVDTRTTQRQQDTKAMSGLATIAADQVMGPIEAPMARGEMRANLQSYVNPVDGNLQPFSSGEQDLDREYSPSDIAALDRVESSLQNDVRRNQRRNEFEAEHARRMAYAQQMAQPVQRRRWTLEPGEEPTYERIDEDRKYVDAAMNNIEFDPSDNTRELAPDRSVTPPPPVNAKFGRNTKPNNITDRVKKSIKDAVANKRYRGMAINGKIAGDPNISIMDVSIGSEYISRILAQPNNPLFALVSDQIDLNIDPSSPDFVYQVIDVINASNIMVAVSKSPVNRYSSMQKRRLRVHYGSGIKMNPMAAKTFNADFDGDEANVSFAKRAIRAAINAMAVVFDVGGEVNFDKDFFPTPDYTVPGSKEYLFDNVLGQFDNIDKQNIYDALVALGKDPSNDKAFRNLIETMYKSFDSDSMSEDDYYRAVANLFDSIYNGSRYVSMLSSAYRAEAAGDVVDFAAVADKNNYGRALCETANEIAHEMLVYGRPAMNHQQFKDKFCAYAGEVGGKNVAFRFIANIAKMFRYDPRLNIGDDINFSELFECTCKFCEAKLISNAASADHKALTPKQMIQQRVIESVGFPDSLMNDDVTPRYNSFYEFFYSFVREYQNQANFIRMADFQMTTDMHVHQNYNLKTISPKKGEKDLTIGSAVDAFMNVYGDYSVERIFGKFLAITPDYAKRERGQVERSSWIENGIIQHINDKYGGESLYFFKVHNDILSGLSEGESSSKKPLKGDREDYAIDVLKAIADSRTSSALEFYHRFYDTTVIHDAKDKFEDKTVVENTYELLYRLTKALELTQKKNDAQDYMYMNDIFDVLFEMGRDLFYYHGMDDMQAFLKSKYGTELRNVIFDKISKKEKLQKIGSIRIAMLAEYRFSRIDNVRGKLEEARQLHHVADEAKYKTEIDQEFDALASSSLFWRGIVTDILRGNPSFEVLKDEVILPGHTSAMVKNASDYWSNPSHSNAYEVLVDTEISFDKKADIISDIIRFTLNRPDLASMEMGYQLERDTSTTHSDNPASSERVMKIADDMQDRYKSYQKKTKGNALQDIEDAYESFKNENKLDLITTALRMMADQPWLMTRVSDDIYADAICSSLDVRYKMSEKSSQHEWTDALFSALSLQRNGGYQNDVYRTDDRALGLLHCRSVTPHEVIKALANPDFSITLYNDNGLTCVLSQKTLMMGYMSGEVATADEIWNFLRNNPRIATALRVNNVNVFNTDIDTGKTYASALLNIGNSLNNVLHTSYEDSQFEHAKYLLHDHPTFGAMVALFTPTENRVSRLQRSRYIETENALVAEFLRLASIVQSGEMIAGTELLNLKIHPDTFRSVASDEYSSEFIDYIDNDDLVNEIRDIDSISADDAYRIISSHINDYVSELAREIPLIELGERIKTTLNEAPELKMDRVSMQAFFSVRQDLNGAKTNISTSVEGSETFYLGPWIALLNSKDHFTDLRSLEGSYDDVSFINGLTVIMPDGSVETIEDNIDELLARAEEWSNENNNKDYGVVIKMPDEWLESNDIPDATTDSYGSQTSSIASYMLIKRDNGAEKYNLKIKKFGDDGTDSITKFTKYIGADYHVIKDELQELFNETGDLDVVKHRLAQKLYDANFNMDGNGIIKYKELNLGNYVCIADIMVYQSGDTIGLRSLEMMANAVKYGMPHELVENGTVEEMRAAAQASIQDIGVEDLDPRWARSLVLQGLRVASPNSRQTTSGYKARSSSFSRNYELINEIAEANPEVNVLYPGQITKRVNAINKAHQINESGYNVIGVIDKTTDIVENIGPTNAWFVKSNADSDQVKIATDRAYQLGITMLFDNYEDIPDFYRSEAIKYGYNWLIPTFDMRLNGSEVKPSDAKFAVYKSDPSTETFSYEDSLNEFSLGDAMVQFFNNLVDRINVNWSDDAYISFESMFPNVYRAFLNSKVEVSFASRDVVERYIIRGEEHAFDYGVTPESKNFKERQQRIDALIDKYKASYYTNADNNAIMSWKTCNSFDAGDIVAFADIAITDKDVTWHVLAPVIPFGLKDSSTVPTKYKITGYSVDKNGFRLGWTYDGSLLNKIFKIFEGAGSANKSIASTNYVADDKTLPCGVKLDYAVATPSTASRRVGTDRRIKTMNTLMSIARRKGYNFGDLDDSFPNNRELAEVLQVGEIPMEDWENIINDDAFVYHNDAEINSFVKMQVRQFYENGGNPSWYLASHFDGKPNNVRWEWEAMYSNSLFYENAWLKFHNMMDNKLCPPNVFDTGTTTYDFKVNQNGGFDYGCLQMQVPHTTTDPSGSVRNWYTWESVFSGESFLGEEYSGFHKPSLNGASMYLDAMNSLNMKGDVLDTLDVRNLLKWAWADTPDRGHTLGSIVMDTNLNEQKEENKKPEPKENKEPKQEENKEPEQLDLFNSQQSTVNRFDARNNPNVIRTGEMYTMPYDGKQTEIVYLDGTKYYMDENGTLLL